MRFAHCLVLVGLTSLSWAKQSKQKEIKPEPNIVDVKLAAQDDSTVKVTVKNLGKKKLSFFQRGNLLDENPVHKLDVAGHEDGLAPFIGLHPRVRIDGKLDSKSFRSINGGESVDLIVDVASLYDLSAGGKFEVSADSSIPFAKSGRKITGEALYKSNKITLEVNGTRAAEVKAKLHSKRNLLQADCTAGRLDSAKNALAVCSSLAYVAGVQALHGNNDQFFRYFRTLDPGVRGTVSRRFLAVADECGARSDKAKTFCTDQRRLCRSDYISYTLGTEVTNCDLYWQFPLISRNCHGVGQATTTIHEMTHIDGLMDPSTDDFPGHYGWPALSTLPPEQAIMNGDNYGFYANAVYTNDVNC